jgi:cation transport ATPase
MSNPQQANNTQKDNKDNIYTPSSIASTSSLVSFDYSLTASESQNQQTKIIKQQDSVVKEINKATQQDSVVKEINKATQQDSVVKEINKAREIKHEGKTRDRDVGVQNITDNQSKNQKKVNSGNKNPRQRRNVLAQNILEILLWFIMLYLCILAITYKFERQFLNYSFFFLFISLIVFYLYKDYDLSINLNIKNFYFFLFLSSIFLFRNYLYAYLPVVFICTLLYFYLRYIELTTINLKTVFTFLTITCFSISFFGTFLFNYFPYLNYSFNMSYEFFFLGWFFLYFTLGDYKIYYFFISYATLLFMELFLPNQTLFLSSVLSSLIIFLSIINFTILLKKSLCIELFNKRKIQQFSRQKKNLQECFS